MADRTEISARLAFWRTALEKKREAYLALLDGGVQSYTLEGRSLTKFDLNTLKREIEDAERIVDELTQLLSGKRPRRAFRIVPME